MNFFVDKSVPAERDKSDVVVQLLDIGQPAPRYDSL
jgi:hypothetical protein